MGVHYVRGNPGEKGSTDLELVSQETTLSRVLQGHGYYTGAVGKWGMGNRKGRPDRQGFDFFFGQLGHVESVSWVEGLVVAVVGMCWGVHLVVGIVVWNFHYVGLL